VWRQKIFVFRILLLNLLSSSVSVKNINVGMVYLLVLDTKTFKVTVVQEFAFRIFSS
jgi:hypothetical protein